MPGRDTRTRYQGVYGRHRKDCPLSTGGGKRCACAPTYFGVAWDKAAGRQRKTRRHETVAAARNARNDLADQLRKGALPVSTAGPRFDVARARFVKDARDGVAMNKWGRRYRPRAVEDLESALRQVGETLARRRLGDITRGEIQRRVDRLAADGKSGSRIRSIVNAIRSLYRWAQDRELVNHDPAALVRLPAMNATPRERVATPGEFAALLEQLERRDALPWALAGYATARHQEIRTLDWSAVDTRQFQAIELAADEDGRKPGGSWRIVPLIAPLRALLRTEWLSQGKPSTGKVCPPRRTGSKSGMVALSHLLAQGVERWRAAGLEPIGLHEARHTASTWLDHAGVSPKVASMLMGHQTPAYQPGAASITLSRYTHVLPGELERARDQLERFVAERTIEEIESRDVSAQGVAKR